MKPRWCLFILFGLMLSGCHATNHDHQLSELQLSNLVVTEQTEQLTDSHEIMVSFDYEFTAYFAQPKLYFCSIQFLQKQQGRSFANANKRFEQCHFTGPKGSINFRWPSPLDRSLQSNKVTESLLLPVQYFVAVHQRTALNTSILIARSETFQSTK